MSELEAIRQRNEERKRLGAIGHPSRECRCVESEDIEYLLSLVQIGPCCLDNTHTTHWSDGYTQRCKTHDTKRFTDTGWNR